ncbi:lytic murein transglycosylase [Salinicola halophilus]|uniref:lytic murein transglycosylase n=1 Tax=Salinicola halophilus TaxID=184065 RepID=UPI001EF93979|nr:lytic murein transglycosylase [Salinicola halophilus]
MTRSSFSYRHVVSASADRPGPPSRRRAAALSLCLSLSLMGCQSVADTQAPSANGAATASAGETGAADQPNPGSSSQPSPAPSNESNSGSSNPPNSGASNEPSAQASSNGIDASTSRDSAEFDAWVASFRRHAAAEGIDRATLEAAFGQASFQPKILEYDRSQPEFSRQIWSYLDTAVSDSRISNGRERLAAHRDTASAVEREYGVPAEVIVAIWGIESNYGSNFGDFETIDALSTLGFDGRRQSFARDELMAALEILQNGDIDRDRMRGSWAGAMGHTQFIPSSFLAYAVDEDGDGRRDIWGSIPDVMASTANYLARAGWRTGQPWGAEVRLPENFDYAQTELDTRHSSQEWIAQGVAAVAGAALPDFAEASVIAPAGAQGPAFLVGPNFRAILRYNASTSYALAVAKLSDRIAGRGGIQADWPRSEPALSRSQIRRLQSALNANGFDVGTPDGLVGPNTRKGLRAYQRSIGTTPDGYPTQRLIQRLTGG